MADAPNPPIDLQRILVSALQLQQAGDLKGAVEIYRDVLQVAPDNPDAHHLLGLAAAQGGNLAMAQELVSRAVALNPAETSYRADLGRLLVEQGKSAAARECFAGLLAIDPMNVQAIEGLKTLAVHPAATLPVSAVAPGPSTGETSPRIAKKDVPAAIAEGVSLQQAGRIDEAAIRYRAVLAVAPDNPDALNLLGVIAEERRDYALAVRLLKKALRRAPAIAMIHNNLGSALQGAGKVDEAIQSYKKAIALDPSMAEAHLNLSTALEECCDFESALAQYRRAIELRPGFTKAYQNLGRLLNAREGGEAGVAELIHAIGLAPLDALVRVDIATLLLRLDRDEEAKSHLELALALAPDKAEVQNAYGWLLQKQGQLQAATEHYQRALDIRPEYPEALNNLGAVLNETARLEDALVALKRALELKPVGYVDPLINLSVVLNNLDRYEEALAYAEQGLAQAPKVAELWNSAGCIYRNLAKFDKAEQHFRRALELKPGLLDALNNEALMLRAKGHPEESEALYREALKRGKHDVILKWNLGLTLVSQGKLAEGWECFELRWQTTLRNVANRFPQRWWNGEPLAGKRILLRAEQGVGDEIMFASPIGDVVQQAAECLIEVDPRLAPLFARSYPKARVFGRYETPDLQLLDCAIDFQVPFGNLFRWLRPNHAAFPRQGGFLIPDRERAVFFRQRLGSVGGGLVVGISWRSRLTTHLRKAEFTELKQWAPIFAIPGLTFVNLQYDESRTEIAEAERLFGVKIHAFDDVDLFNDLDTAAAMTAACDVVVSAPTSVSAMAGALGVPCYRMTVPEDWIDLGADWVPFLPSVTLLKRRLDEDWQRVIDKVAAGLRQRAGA